MNKVGIENKVPVIRFEGFSGEWANSKLGELLDITSAARVHKNEWADTGVPFFRTSDVVSIYKGEENKKAYISVELYKELSARSGSVKKDDLLITGGGSIGIPFLIKTNKPLYFKDADLLWLKNVSETNGYLLFTFFSSPVFRRYVGSITHIGTISHYTIEQAKTTPIHIPEECNEQTKIGEYFQQLDSLIAQHQQKHDKLLNLKKALLEKMFPKQGATEPAIRFKGFSGAWEDKALGDESKITMGQSPNGINYTNNPEDHILVQGNADMKNGVVEPRIWTTQVTKVANAGDLIFSVRAPVGEIGKTAHNLVIGRGVAAIKGNEFIFQSLRKMNENGYWKKLSAGSTFDSINSTDLSTAKVQLPQKDEQTKIGTLFKHLDTLITQHQAQLNKLNNIKQACLAKMFV